jgi:hypothetical protein
MRQQLLKRQQKELKKRVDDLKSNKRNKRSKNMLKTQQVDERCMNSNQLSIKTTCVKNKSHKIKIHLLTEYLTSDDDC